MVAREVMQRMLARYEAGELIAVCAWCRRVELDRAWVLAPRAALTAINDSYTLSGSICPACATQLELAPTGSAEKPKPQAFASRRTRREPNPRRRDPRWSSSPRPAQPAWHS